MRGLLTEARLVTLTGVGGVGKSRLAVHVARQIKRTFKDGVWFVELAKLRDPSLVGIAVSAALGLPETFSARDPEEALADYLADQESLLLLDNCEHLLDSCAHLVNIVLAAAPGLRVLATSREPLGLTGEYVWPVQPLTLPTSDHGSPGEAAGRRYEALVLFEDRASAVCGFALDPQNASAVSQLCQRLDGLPLAIELAAVWLRSLSVEQVLARLDNRYRLLSRGSRDAPPRHQTLRAAVEWSFDLCTDLERTLWARLSVFAGDIDLEAAEEVCAGDDLPAQDVMLGLADLVNKSILARRGQGAHSRYRMLETIRQYGRERLAEIGEEVTLRRRHRDYYLRLIEKAEADWFGPRQPMWLDRFQVERPDVWAALDFCLTEPGEAKTGLRMAGGLWWYWTGRASWDGRQWLDRLLSVEGGPSRERAKALWVNSLQALALGQVTETLSIADECIALADALGDDFASACANHWIGTVKWSQNLLPEAVAYLEQAIRLHGPGPPRDSLSALTSGNLGMVAGLLGDVSRAHALCEQSRAACEALGEHWARAWALWDFAIAVWSQGDIRRADEYMKQALHHKWAIRDQLGIPVCVEVLAWVAMADGHAERAAVLLGMSDKLWEPMGARLFGVNRFLQWSEQCQSRARDVLGDRAFQAAYLRGTQHSADTAVAYALGKAPATPAEPSPAAAPAMPRLTRREREVAELVAQGRSNKEIAAELVISQRTAEGHVEHIMAKLGFTSRAQIAAWVTEHHNHDAPR